MTAALGYSYELATRLGEDGQYTGWQKCIAFQEPSVPPGSIRNLVALDARQSPTPTKPDLISPWEQEPDATILKMLGKLGEESGELATAACRCVIQGLAESEPVTGKPNTRMLEDEIADVRACLYVLDELLEARKRSLDLRYIHARMMRKVDGFRTWAAGMAHSGG